MTVYAPFILAYSLSLFFHSDDDDGEAVWKAISTRNLNIFVVSRDGDGLDKQDGIATEGTEVLPDGLTFFFFFN